MNIYYYKVVGINILQFWKNILKMSIFPICMMFIGLVIVHVIGINNWGMFFASVIVYTMLYCFGMYILNMNDYEKNIIRKPLKKLALSIIRR